MRGIDTPVRQMRRHIFKEIAQLAYHSDNLNDDVEALPYKIVNPETPIYRESIYREREIVREQIRLAMGLSLRPEDQPVDVEALPYKIVNPETPIYRESIYREREIVREQIRLAMGLSLRPEDQPVHVTQGLEESNIDEKYYEPPMIQVIPSACNACPENDYIVTDLCKGCVAGRE